MNVTFLVDGIISRTYILIRSYLLIIVPQIVPELLHLSLKIFEGVILTCRPTITLVAEDEKLVFVPTLFISANVLNT